MSKVLRRQPTHPVVYGLKASPSFPLDVAVSCSYSGFQLMEHPYLSAAICFAFWQSRFFCVFFSNSCSNFDSKHQNNVLYLEVRIQRNIIFHFLDLLTSYSKHNGPVKKGSNFFCCAAIGFPYTEMFSFLIRECINLQKGSFRNIMYFLLTNSIFKGCFLLC